MPHFVADELFPQFIDSNRIVFLNSPYTLPPAFAEQSSNGGKINRIKFQSVAMDDAFSYRNDLIAYTAFEPDLRWGWRDYSVIRVLNIRTKKDIRLRGRLEWTIDVRGFRACDSSLHGKSRFLCAARFGMTRTSNFMDN